MLSQEFILPLSDFSLHPHSLLCHNNTFCHRILQNCATDAKTLGDEKEEQQKTPNEAQGWSQQRITADIESIPFTQTLIKLL